MKKFKPDFVSVMVGLVVVAILFAVGIISTCNNVAEAKANVPVTVVETQFGNTMAGVYVIDVTDWSRYIIDARFGSCFYETYTVNGIAVADISEGYICQRLRSKVRDD